jgi:hypothetical protein
MMDKNNPYMSMKIAPVVIIGGIALLGAAIIASAAAIKKLTESGSEPR